MFQSFISCLLSYLPLLAKPQFVLGTGSHSRPGSVTLDNTESSTFNAIHIVILIVVAMVFDT